MMLNTENQHACPMIEQLPVEVLHLCLSFSDFRAMGMLLSLNRTFQQIVSSFLVSVGLNDSTTKPVSTFGGGSQRTLRLNPREYASIIDGCEYAECLNIFDLYMFHIYDDEQKDGRQKQKYKENEYLRTSILKFMERNVNNLQQLHLNIRWLPNRSQDQIWNCLSMLRELRSLSIHCNYFRSSLKSLISNLPHLLSLRIKSDCECDLNSDISPGILQNLKKLDFQGMGQDLLENEDFPSIFPQLEEFSYTIPRWGVHLSLDEESIRSLGSRTSKLRKLSITGESHVLFLKTPVQKMVYVDLFKCLRVLEFTCNIEGDFELLKTEFQFPRYIEEATISSSFATHFLAPMLTSSKELKTLTLIDCLSLEFIVQELKGKLDKCFVSKLALNRLTLKHGSLTHSSLFHLLSMITDLKWLTFESINIPMERLPYQCHGIAIPLRRIEIFKGQVSTNVAYNLLLVSGTTIEKLITQKTYWSGASATHHVGFEISTSHFARLSHLIMDDCSGSPHQILNFLTDFSLPSLRDLSLREMQSMTESLLVQFLKNSPLLSHFNFEGISCTDELLRIIANRFELKHLALEGSITEDGLLSLGDELIANLESVCLASCIFNDEAKIIQFIQKCTNLHTLKINFGKTAKPTRAFFETLLNHCSKTLHVLLCGGKGDPNLISDGRIIEDLIMECKHLSIFVVDFCPDTLDQGQLTSKCRSRSDRSSVPKIILSQMTRSSRENQNGRSLHCSLQ